MSLNRFLLSLVGSILLATPLWCQSTLYTSISISTNPSGARFTVDNQPYTSTVVFSWPIGSKHTLVFITDPLLPGQTAGTTFQTSTDGGTVYAFGGWRDGFRAGSDGRGYGVRLLVGSILLVCHLAAPLQCHVYPAVVPIMPGGVGP